MLQKKFVSVSLRLQFAPIPPIRAFLALILYRLWKNLGNPLYSENGHKEPDAEMAHNQRPQRQQAQRCTICALFQSMGRGQYRSSYDREMHLHHLQTAHGAKLSEELVSQTQPKGGVLLE